MHLEQLERSPSRVLKCSSEVLFACICLTRGRHQSMHPIKALSENTECPAFAMHVADYSRAGHHSSFQSPEQINILVSGLGKGVTLRNTFDTAAAHKQLQWQQLCCMSRVSSLALVICALSCRLRFARSALLACPAVQPTECDEHGAGGLGLHAVHGNPHGPAGGSDAEDPGVARRPARGGAPDTHQRPHRHLPGALHVRLLRLQHRRR